MSFFLPAVVAPKKGNKKTKVCHRLFPPPPSPTPRHLVSRLCVVLQGANIFAALSQGMSDEEDDSDLDEEVEPVKKVSYRLAPLKQ